MSKNQEKLHFQLKKFIVNVGWLIKFMRLEWTS